MTRQKGSWKKKSETEFIILKNLVLMGPMESVQFEKLANPVPHASAVKILAELQSMEWIKKISVRNSKRGLLVPSFRITLLGLIRLFVIIKELNEKITTVEIRSLIISAQDLIPWIAKNWNDLSKLYNESGMFNLLISICETIKVENPEIINKTVKGELRRFGPRDVKTRTKAKGIWIGLSHDDRTIIFDFMYKNDEETIEALLVVYFVYGLSRYAVTKDSQAEYFSNLYTIENNSLTKLLRLLDDSDIRLNYEAHLESEKSNHTQELSILNNLIKKTRITFGNSK